ncbi:hypothetical protein RJ639_015288 [Escallonia herrerae]|uniref:Protein kinase domain-containing protein n=1 Tax=Escallonia herrerae TaxID=1293975 RepID=A0AA89AKW6_9ASTE|nr:hypothetical protein RJ639_015288 [Escallonia herrerae]
MGVHGVAVIMLVFLFTKARAQAVQPVALLGCQDTCGVVSIPFPFGIGAVCAAKESFVIRCDNYTSSNGHLFWSKPFIGNTSVEVVEISLNQRTVSVNNPINFSSNGHLFFPDTYTQFASVLSWTYKNGFCNGSAIDGTNAYIYCEGKARCGNQTDCYCAYGYEGNPFLQDGCRGVNKCLEARIYTESDKEPLNGNAICSRSGGKCVITEGDYICICPSGYLGDRYGCYNIKNRKAWMAIIGTCSGLGALFVLVCSWWLYKIMRRRRKKQLKKKFFKRNGGLILQQQLSSGEEGHVEKTKVYTSKALEKATDNFNQNRVLGQGGQGTVYKGMLPDGRIVAIKKSKIDDNDEGKVKHFINEVVILSRISHRNVIKLHGCCLETEIPLLVYEFIPNGTLFEFIHGKNEELPLSCWDMRLRIATEVAGALSYLHSDAAIPIYHRDIKSTNILLDEKYISKVADFGTSRSISVDQTHLTTRVLGTWGYFDPEYFRSSQFTDKSDVYSFGVVLIELLTGQKPISSIKSKEARSLVTEFILAMKEDCLHDILDARVVKEGGKEEVMIVANLAKRCLHLNGRKRPTMKEVAMELEEIKKWHGVPDRQHHKEEEVECAIDTEQMGTWDTVSTSTKSLPNNSLSSSSNI